MLLSSIISFSNDAAAIEKTLRGIQGLATIAIGFYQQQPQHTHTHTQMIQEHVEMWIKLRGELALGRRYFRLLKWYPCWEIAWEKILAGSSSNGIGGSAAGRGSTTLRQMLEGMKYAFLGMYFFLEMLTITNALGVTHYTWGPYVQTEANRCWFYSISISILLGLYSMMMMTISSLSTTTTTTTATTTATTTTGEKKKEEISSSDYDDDDDDDDDAAAADKKKKKNNLQQQQQQQHQQLIIDFADLVIPGAAVGWIPVGPIVVGMASTVSTVLTGRQIWKRVMREQEEKRK